MTIHAHTTFFFSVFNFTLLSLIIVTLCISQGASDHILQFLFQLLARPEFQVRFHWQNNSVAIWDNRITQHYAVNDYLPNSRHMQRVTIINDKRVK